MTLIEDTNIATGIAPSAIAAAAGHPVAIVGDPWTVDADGSPHTGDLARSDSGGRLYTVGRVKELIKYHGFRVAPAELEAVLLKHPDGADVAVIGVADVEVGEVPTTYVVVRAGGATTPQDLRTSSLRGSLRTSGCDEWNSSTRSPSLPRERSCQRAPRHRRRPRRGGHHHHHHYERLIDVAPTWRFVRTRGTTGNDDGSNVRGRGR